MTNRVPSETRSIPLKPGGCVGWRQLAAGVAAVLGLTLAVVVVAADDRAAVAAARAETALLEVQQLIGAATCTSDEQCRTMAIGSKSCGGPERYLAWAPAQTDARALAAAAERYAAARRLQREKQGGPASDCAWVVDPGAWCRVVADAVPARPKVRQCVLRATAPGAAGRD